jgi:hypothetical protein
LKSLSINSSLAGCGPISYVWWTHDPHFQDIKPTIPTSCFVEETGIVMGDVGLGEHCSVSFHAVIRVDPLHILIFSFPLEGEEVAL